MKWFVLTVCLMGVVPLSAWLRRNSRLRPKIWMLAGFLPFILSDLHLYMAVVSWADWGGWGKGAEVSVLDVLMLAIYFSSPSSRHPLPFKLSMALYFVAVLLSTLQAEFPVAALFYVWQLARMFLVYAVVTQAVSADPRVAPALLTGTAAGLFMEAGVGIWDRFAFGIVQSGGTIGAQNLLGLISHLITFPSFALLLAGTTGWVLPIAVLSGIVVDLLTVSRASLGLAALGFVLLFILSALRRWTSRKAMILFAGLAVIAIAAPLAALSFKERDHINDPAASDFERAAYVKAAEMMFADHPFGVGANQFTLIANTGGYYRRAGVSSYQPSLAGNVHNSYLLVAAETGYPGLLFFILLLLRPLIVAFRCGWRCRESSRGDLLLGLGVALLIVYTHSLFEWSLVTFQAQYILMFTIGSIAGVAQQLGYWRQIGARKPSSDQKPPGKSLSASPSLPASNSLRPLARGDSKKL